MRHSKSLKTLSDAGYTVCGLGNVSSPRPQLARRPSICRILITAFPTLPLDMKYLLKCMIGYILIIVSKLMNDIGMDQFAPRCR